MFNIDLGNQEFNGPLDLLLGLIQDKEMDISEISISSVTEQYLDYLEKIEDKDPDELADFLVTATRLLLLKSSKLLPKLFYEEDDGPSLIDQLKLYEKFVQTAVQINKIWLNPKKSYFRVEPPVIPENPEPPENFTMEKLHESMVNLIRRLKPPKPLPETQIDKAVSLKERIKHIRDLLKSQKSFGFKDLLGSSVNKTDVIVNFLAILELVKQKSIFLYQDKSFGDIVINKV